MAILFRPVGDRINSIQLYVDVYWERGSSFLLKFCGKGGGEGFGVPYLDTEQPLKVDISFSYRFSVHPKRFSGVNNHLVHVRNSSNKPDHTPQHQQTPIKIPVTSAKEVSNIYSS